LKRARLSLTASLCLLLLAPAGALGAVGAVSATRQAPRATAGIARGAVSWIDQDSLTILQGTRRMPVLAALERAANAVDRADLPYVYAGGHANAGTASIGRKGPGYTGRTLGYDCSGSVAAVLSGAGLWPAGAPVPADNGVISQLRHAGIVAPGPGTVTLYDKPGVHIFMNITGRYFGTSDGLAGNANQPHHGAGWLSDGAPDARNPAFKAYHILPARLRSSTLYGTSLTFRAPSGLDLRGFVAGDPVRVAYRTATAGSLIARSVDYADATTAVGILVSLDADHGTFSLQGDSGLLTFSDDMRLVDESQLGDRLEVTYTTRPSGPAAHAVEDLAAATLLDANGMITQIAEDQSSVSIQTSSGQTLAFASDPSRLDGLSVGDNVDVSYIQAGAALIVRDVQPSPDPEPPPSSASVRSIAG
jgi:hypothetical protein